jgi:hypothetical protein
LGEKLRIEKSKESGGEGGIRKQRTIHEDQQLADLAENASPLRSPPIPVFTFRFATTPRADAT